MSEPLKMLLWPDGAPGAKGDAVEDKPDLTLYMPENYDISKPRGLVVVLPAAIISRRPMKGNRSRKC